MDLRDSKVQKLLLVGLAALLLVYFWHSKVYEPNEQALAAKRVSYEGLMSNLFPVHTILLSIDILYSEISRILLLEIKFPFNTEN